MTKVETKFIVFIVMSVIIGASIFGYGYLDYRYKKEALEQKIESDKQTRIEKKKTEDEKRSLLQDCLDEVGESRQAYWAQFCIEVNGVPYDLDDFYTRIGNDGKTYYVNKEDKIMYTESFVWKMVPPGDQGFEVNDEVSKNCKLPVIQIDRIDKDIKEKKDECFKKYPL